MHRRKIRVASQSHCNVYDGLDKYKCINYNIIIYDDDGILVCKFIYTDYLKTSYIHIYEIYATRFEVIEYGISSRYNVY